MRAQEAACHPSLGLSNLRSDTQVATGSCTQTILGEALGLSHLGLVRKLLVILAFISSSLFPLSNYTVTILFIALVLEGQVSKHICVFHSRALVL